MVKFEETKALHGDPLTGSWLNTITKTNTRNTYTNAMRLYLRFTGLTPRQLVDEGIEDMKRAPRERADTVPTRIVKFYGFLKNEYESARESSKIGMSDKGALTWITAIRSFYSYFDIYVKLRGKTSLPRPKVENRRLIVNSEQVKILLDHMTTLRDRAAVLVMFQGGIDVSTLCSLRYGALAQSLEKGEYPIKLNLQRIKTGIEYHTFIGRSAAEALRAYVREMKSRGVIFVNSTPLFLKERDTAGNGGRDMSPKLFQIVMKEAAAKAGFVDSKGYNVLGPLALRESFRSIMINSGVPVIIVDFWLGHDIGELGRTYETVQSESVRKMYAEGERLLDPYLSAGSRDLKKIEEELSRETGDLKEKLLYLMGQYVKGERALETLREENLVLKNRVERMDVLVKELAKRIGFGTLKA